MDRMREGEAQKIRALMLRNHVEETAHARL